MPCTNMVPRPLAHPNPVKLPVKLPDIHLQHICLSGQQKPQCWLQSATKPVFNVQQCPYVWRNTPQVLVISELHSPTNWATTQSQLNYAKPALSLLQSTCGPWHTIKKGIHNTYFKYWSVMHLPVTATQYIHSLIHKPQCIKSKYNQSLEA